MKKKNRRLYPLIVTLAMFLATPSVSAESESDATRPDGWSDVSHSKSADPNYDVVFPDSEVNTMTIIIDPDDWQTMLDDLTDLYGEPGSVGDGPGQRPGDRRPGPGGPGQGGPPGGNFASENPIWVTATIQFEGDVWTDVGVRFKGNSSLSNTWSSGSLELPFKLDFDEFEDEKPAIKNQRFYGFKQLSLSNNTNDSTFMRDAVASDIMAAEGIISAETAFYNLIVDYGDRPVSFGLYTMVEVIDDTVIERTLGSDDGNIYEADGAAVSLAKGTFDGIAASFEKENNEDEADWSDIEAVYAALHSNTRQTDPETWREGLETVFDVETFLHWLAINTVIENWDTYGAMTHNFYLYSNPETGLLTWIPWDYNEALNEGRRSDMTLDMDRIGNEWPLISYLLADDEYYGNYVNYVDSTITGVFEGGAMEARYREIAELIAPYAAEKIGANAFTRAVQELIDHTYSRITAAERFLAQRR
ncbi:MAG: CotH kinase family protein [Spirochaetales bacterium]|jgi:spore coat protein H|nr:CotH kinase family protein [Spirochaetales bacterium]